MTGELTVRILRRSSEPSETKDDNGLFVFSFGGSSDNYEASATTRDGKVYVAVKHDLFRAIDAAIDQAARAVDRHPTSLRPESVELVLEPVAVLGPRPTGTLDEDDELPTLEPTS